MAPTFKKPLEYNPGLAASTLARTVDQNDAAREARKKSMLAELGLGDEGIDLDDEDDDDFDDDDDDDDDGMLPDDSERPIFSNGNKTALGKGAAGSSSSRKPESYGYRDVFSREFQRQRQQHINTKGYDRFLEQLLERSHEALQLLRSDTQLMYPGSVEIIGELEHEVQVLSQENSNLREMAANGSPLTSPSVNAAGNDKQLDQLNRELAAFREQVVGLERLVQSKDERIRVLQAQLRAAKDAEATATTAAAAAAAGVGTAAVGGAVGASASSAALSEESKEQLAALEAKNAELEKHNASLERALSASKAQADAKAAEADAKSAELASAIRLLSDSSDSGAKAAALAAQVSALTAAAAAHTAQMSKLETDLKEQTALVASLQVQNTQARSAAASEVSGKMAHMKKIIQDVHKLRTEVLAELVAVQNEVFSNDAIKVMSRSVRDKEISLIQRIEAGSASEVQAALRRAEEAEEDRNSMQARCDQQIRIQQLEAEGQIMHYKDKWKMEFDRRRKLHNQVVELKGNIRVLCRVRPLLEKEKQHGGNEDPPVKATGEELVKVPAGPNGAIKEYEFDRCFGEQEGQEQVFEEVRNLVVSVLDGFNVCIMAYGQTGSGKTFTMEGPDENPGVNMRSLTELFQMAEERTGVFEYTFSASVLEIYNEQIFDLLAGGRDQEDKLDVKQNTDGRMHVPGLTIEEVANVEEVHRVIGIGKGNRSTFATNMNEHSSRSHLVLSVYVTGVNQKTNNTIKGKLHLIDLAGSERIARTNAQGDRLKEAQNINKSLSALGDVIQALQQKNSHIPYRNSKLTRLLEDSLGHNAKTIMVVNVSPAAENTGETKCSLEFASRARKVELGRAKANVDSPGRGTRTPGSNTPESLSRVNSTGGNLADAGTPPPRGASKLRTPGR